MMPVKFTFAIHTRNWIQTTRLKPGSGRQSIT